MIAQYKFKFKLFYGAMFHMADLGQTYHNGKPPQSLPLVKLQSQPDTIPQYKIRLLKHLH